MPFSPGGFSHLRSGGSKVFLHRILERTPVPTLWTSNATREICQTVLRRMIFTLELRKPPCRVRERIWGRELARHNIKATEEDTRSLAKEFDLTPGVASSAIAGASLCGGDLAAVRLGVRSLAKVISGEKPPANQGPPERFDLALVRADINPVGFADRIVASGGKHFSLCLQGPPGTGKSAFVPLLSRTPRPPSDPKACLRPNVDVGRPNRTANRRSLCRGPRRRLHPRLRRGRLLALRTAKVPYTLGKSAKSTKC